MSSSHSEQLLEERENQGILPVLLVPGGPAVKNGFCVSLARPCIGVPRPARPYIFLGVFHVMCL